MTNLVIGLLAAALSTNSPAAASSLAADNSRLVLQVNNTNDPVDTAFHKILLDDDAAEQDVLKWSDEADQFSGAGAGDAKITLSARIRKRLDGIRGEYENFIALHPNHASARLAFGSFLNDTGDEEGSVVQWEKARDLDPKNPAAWNNLANYYGHRGPVKKAFEYYEKAIEIDDHESVYYHNLATTVYLFRVDAEDYYHLNETEVFDKALELYRKAISLSPDDFVLYSDYAESFYGTKPPRWQDGLQAWNEALKIAHDDVERQGVYVHLARIHLKLGHYDEATRNLGIVTNQMYATLRGRIVRNLIDTLLTNESVSPASFNQTLDALVNYQPSQKVPFTNYESPTARGLESLRAAGREYKDFKLASGSETNAHPEFFSLQIGGGVRYLTACSGDRMGAVKLPEAQARKCEILLNKYITQRLQGQVEPGSRWKLVVKCNRATGARMGDGTDRLSIPTVETDGELKSAGLAVYAGGLAQPLVSGSIYLVDTKEKLLVLQKDFATYGTDVETALYRFAEAVTKE